MAYGNLKADNLIYDDNGTDTVLPLENVAGKAPLANPAFTGSVTIDRATTGEDIAKFKSDGSCELYHNDVLRLSTTNVAVDVSGILTVSGNANFGLTSNTSITSSSDGAGGWHTMLENSSTGDLYLRGTEFYLQDNTTGNANQSWIHCLPSAGVSLYYDGGRAAHTTQNGIIVEAHNTSIPGLQASVEVGNHGNIKLQSFDDNVNNSAEDNNTFKIYSQHGSNNTTKTSILYQSFFDQVWRVQGGNSSGCSGIEDAELGRINHDGGWELRYHDVQGSAPAWTGTTCDKKLETTADGVTITGNLTVTGNTTEINSTTLTVDDKNIELGTVATPTDTTADGGGITLKGATDKTILWTDATDSWDFNQDIKTSGTVTDSKGDVRTIPESSSATNILPADAGKFIPIQAGIILDTNTAFTAGQAVTIYNDQGASNDEVITVTGVTLYLATDPAASGNRTLAGRGMATILCTAANTYVISGAGLS